MDGYQTGCPVRTPMTKKVIQNPRPQVLPLPKGRDGDDDGKTKDSSDLVTFH